MPEAGGTDRADLAAARAALAARQEEVLAALLRGEVPPGFDPPTARTTGSMLRAKRRDEARNAVPPLGDLPDLGARFDAWARDRSRPHCPHCDAIAFVDYVDRDEALPTALLAWWREEQVRSGARRAALIRARGRRELLMGIGSRLLRLAIRPPRSTSE